MSFIVSACQEIAKFVHPGMLAILESTTYPGTTDELVLPLVEHRVKVGEDFSCASLPSAWTRVIPSSRPATFPKWSAVSRRPVPNWGPLLCAGVGERSAGQSTQVAEMVKLLENTFRMINIGLVNELAMMCERCRSISGK